MAKITNKKRLYDKRYREKNKEKIVKKNRKYGQKPEVIEKRRIYNNKLKIKQKRLKYEKEYYQKNRNKIIKNSKDYIKTEIGRKNYLKTRKRFYYKHKDKLLQEAKEYSQRPEVKIKRHKYCRQYTKRPKVREYINKYCREYIKTKYNNNLQFNLKVRLRRLLFYALQQYSKEGKIMTSKKYGINYKSIIEALKPFPKNIKNYQIHHIKPLCSFNFNDPEQIQQAFSPENHMWLTIPEHKEIHNGIINFGDI